MTNGPEFSKNDAGFNPNRRWDSTQSQALTEPPPSPPNPHQDKRIIALNSDVLALERKFRWITPLSKRLFQSGFYVKSGKSDFFFLHRPHVQLSVSVFVGIIGKRFINYPHQQVFGGSR